MHNIDNILEQIKTDSIKESIGTKQEKTIHQFLKYYLCGDSNFHEIKINNHIVDIFYDNHIYEIQTQSFDKMRNKLSCLLDMYPLTIVYPIMIDKTIYKIDELGEVTNIRKSPKKISPISIGFELYKIKDFLYHPNLSFKIVLIKGIEYQKTRLDKYKRIKNTRVDQYPNEILDIIDFKKPLDFSQIIPDNLGLFTIKDFQKISKLTGRKLSSCCLAFRHLGIIELVGKEGKSNVYKKK